METLQAIHEAVGPGKAQEVLTKLKPVYKAGAIMAGIGVTVGEISLGVITNSLVRRFTSWIPDRLHQLGNPGYTPDMGQKTTRGGAIGFYTGEAIRTTLGEAAGVGVSGLGVVHKVAGALEKHALRPLGVRVAETVGRITRGWDTAPVEPKPVVA